MEYKVADLEGVLLDAAVAMAEGAPVDDINPGTPRVPFAYSTDWEYGGPIIERERITVCGPGFMKSGLWEAFIDPLLDVKRPEPDIVGRAEGAGPTPLIAAMRAYVASKFGETVEIDTPTTQKP